MLNKVSGAITLFLAKISEYYILPILISVFVLYMIGAFISVSFYIALWSIYTRVALALVFLAFMVFLTFVKVRSLK